MAPKKPLLLNDVCVAIIDCEHKTAPIQPDGYPSIRTPNIGRGRLILDGVNRVSDETYLQWTQRMEPHADDLILAREAPVGNVAIVPKNLKVCLGQRTVLIRPDQAKVVPGYLVYLLLGDELQGRIHSQSNGATVHHLNMKDIRGLELPLLPSMDEQRRIASILSAYDDLIENNTRRIAILEEMARRLYEEWFVRFRFPGHEGVRMVESEMGLIPEGWRVDPLVKVCPSKDGIQTGPFGSQLHKSDYSSEGVPVLMPKDLLGFRINTETIARIPEATAQSLPRHRMKPGDIVYGRRGDIGRRAFIMAHQSGWFCGTGCLRIRPDPAAINGWYLFNYFGQDNVVGLIAGRAHGVTMPNLNTRLLESVPVVRPPRSLQDQFEQVTFPTASLRETLIAKNINLRTTRDLLLPKLISGELDVSTLPEPQAQTI
ncbi:restriction endonuclease subunit S [Rhodoferax sp. UBA5149]|uniref:restriction endonuclease subunit S n=1 Tax=Rhodoferax sp. UBA5149 TaxID=1947379 RepID=UPI0025E95370|nr:restriction endonuclease subunit S [Rhodoferax sp. UBA5149]